MLYPFFITNYCKVLVLRNIFHIRWNDNGDFTGLNHIIKPPGNFIGIPLNTGKRATKKIAIDKDFRHTYYRSLEIVEKLMAQAG
jgi:hypothetical protein